MWGPFIGGSYVDFEGLETFEVLEAVNGKPMALMVAADEAMVDRAVTDARHAYEDVWSRVCPKERGALMRQVAVKIR